MKKIDEKIVEGMTKLLSVLGTICLALMIICTTTNVIMRVIFNNSPPWTEEFGYMFFCYAVYLGVAVCYKRGELISINAVVLLLPKIVQKIIFYIDRLLLAVVNVFMLLLSIKFTANASEKLTSLMRIPYSVIDACLVIMFVFILYFSIRDLIRAILKLDEMEVERRAE